MKFLGWTNEVNFEGPGGLEARQAVNNVNRFGVFEFDWRNPQTAIDRLPAIVAAGNGSPTPQSDDILAGLAGPYANLARLLLEALKDKQISAQEGTGLVLEIGHLTGLDNKVGNLLGDLIGKLTGRK